MKRIPWAGEKSALWNAQRLVETRQARRGDHSDRRRCGQTPRRFRASAKRSWPRPKVLPPCRNSTTPRSWLAKSSRTRRPRISPRKPSPGTRWETVFARPINRRKPFSPTCAPISFTATTRNNTLAALSEIVRLFRRLKQDDRADEIYARLKQDFPASPWFVKLNNGK